MSELTPIDIEHAKSQRYDYLVIGTGMGGGTIGYALARAGHKVLFIEKGLVRAPGFPVDFPEDRLPVSRPLSTDDADVLRRYGRYTSYIQDASIEGRSAEFVPLLGEGVGGSSTLYGAALERFFPQDFEPQTSYGKYTEATLANWPIGYSDLENYYSEAEDIYAVYGEADPLRPQHQSTNLREAKLTPSGQRIVDHLKSKGLNPYRLPAGHTPWTDKKCCGCQATLCEHSEKSDSSNCCLELACSDYGAQLLDACEVTRLENEGDRITGITAVKGNQEFSLSAPTIILAAGALHTPLLLKKSKNAQWPNGLANDHDLVGRFLCRHYMDMFTVKKGPVTIAREDFNEKELAINDFYFCGDEKLGTLQSLGNPPTGPTILSELLAEFRAHPLPFAYWGLKLACMLPFTTHIVSRVVSGLNLAAVMEDLPYHDNRVTLAADGKTPVIQYRMREEGKSRLKLFRQEILGAFSDYKITLHAQGENNQRLAHATGTCRMGADPANSVVNEVNQVHGITNLYIVDASFFPSSTGINPSLTIAANALRVADHLTAGKQQQ